VYLDTVDEDKPSQAIEGIVGSHSVSLNLYTTGRKFAKLADFLCLCNWRIFSSNSAYHVIYFSYIFLCLPPSDTYLVLYLGELTKDYLRSNLVNLGCIPTLPSMRPTAGIHHHQLLLLLLLHHSGYNQYMFWYIRAAQDPS
jgi:hypothetical protein